MPGLCSVLELRDGVGIFGEKRVFWGKKWEGLGVFRRVWELSVPWHSSLGFSKDSHWESKA